MLLNPFCPLTTAKVLVLKATVVLLLTLLIKAKVRITAFSALGTVLLILLAAAGPLLLLAGGVGFAAGIQQRRTAAA
jgi:hypothetical protein